MNNKSRNPLSNIGTHDFISPKGKTKKVETVRRSYEIPKKLDKKIKQMSLDRGDINEYEIVQEALNEYFNKKEK